MASEVSERWLIVALVVLRNHLRLDGALEAERRSALTILVVVVVGSAVEIGGAFVFIWTTVLPRDLVSTRFLFAL
jgi:hypothetical protein